MLQLSTGQIHKPSRKTNMNIAITGMVYVGLSLGVLLSKSNNVTILDIVSDKVE